MGTTSGMIHFKTIFSSSPGACTHFIDNALWLWCNSFTFCTFRDKQRPSQTPSRQSHSNQIRKTRWSENCPPPPPSIQRSGNSLSRKARTRRDKSGASCDWKTVSSGTRRKAVWTWEGSAEMPHVFVLHCLGTPDGMAFSVVARHFCILQTLVLTHRRPVNRYCLIRIYLIKLALNTGVGFQRCQPQNAFHSASRKISLQLKQIRMELRCLTRRACAKNMTLTKRKTWEIYHTKWTSAQFVSFHFGTMMFYFIAT
jgi:hypothetical protein